MKRFTLKDALTARDEIRSARLRGAVLDGVAGEMLLMLEQALTRWAAVVECVDALGAHVDACPLRFDDGALIVPSDPEVAELIAWVAQLRSLVHETQNDGGSEP